MACCMGVASMKRKAPRGRFKPKRTVENKFYFELWTSNGKPLMTTKPHLYETKIAMYGGIETARRLFPDATIDGLVTELF